MFDAIAGRYDRMNTLMTAGLDRGWRRATMDAAGLAHGDRVLDVACGTGRLALEAVARVGEPGAVVGLDASAGMLAIARADDRRDAVRWLQADAMRMPFANGAFDATVIGFGLRNLPDFEAGLAEMARVTRPGGRVLVLEIARPVAPLPRLLHAIWFRRAVPFIGRLVGHGAAYRYLPASLDAYPDPPGVARLMDRAGLVSVRWRWLRGGMTTLHVGERAP
jgi:demethylmenaquinone methyltransferase/2-methoxy-6-polyprenyl-1,4-benzoquinol methylase